MLSNQKIAGIVVAILGLASLIVLLNASTAEPIISWPIEAYLGTVFTIGWLTNVSDWLAYILAILVFLVVIGVFYKLGSWLYGLVARQD